MSEFWVNLTARNERKWNEICVKENEMEFTGCRVEYGGERPLLFKQIR